MVYTRKDWWQAFCGVVVFFVVSFILVGLPEIFDPYCWEPPLWVLLLIAGVSLVVFLVLENWPLWPRGKDGKHKVK